MLRVTGTRDNNRAIQDDPIIYYLGILKSRGLDWRRNRGATKSVRDSTALIIEAVFSDRPLSLERQDAFLAASYAKTPRHDCW